MISALILAAGASAAAPVWKKADVTLPASSAVFPTGQGADLANAQCITCHSVDMVLQQPALTLEEWTGEVKKMRDAYGAPLVETQIAPLAAYLTRINGRAATPPK